MILGFGDSAYVTMYEPHPHAPSIHSKLPIRFQSIIMRGSPPQWQETASQTIRKHRWEVPAVSRWLYNRSIAIDQRAESSKTTASEPQIDL